MFISIFRYFLLFFCILGVLVAKTKEQIKSYAPVFEEELLKTKNVYKVPGLAIVIIKDDEVVYKKTMGEKENGKKNDINDETIFQIASTTKTFLVFVIAQLVEEGIVSWDTKVKKYMPEICFKNEEANAELTLLDLITHNIGLPPFAGDSLWHMRFDQLELLKALGELDFKYAFREKYTYQNHMFGLAQLVIEKATGKSISQLFEERIFKPLGMKNASSGMEAIQPKFFGLIKPNFAHPHDIRDGKIYTKPISSRTYLFTGSSGINLSVNDATIWMKFMMNNYSQDGKAYLKPETVEFMRKNFTKCFFSKYESQFHKDRFSDTYYAAGMFKSQYGNNKDDILYGHMGGFNGVRSYFCFIPSQKLGMVILSNLGSMTVSLMPEVIRNVFLDWYFGFSGIDWIEEIYKKNQRYLTKYYNNRMQARLYNPLGARKFDDYKGVYNHKLYGKVDIVEEQGKLFLVYKGKKTLLKHWNGNEFSIKPFELMPTLNDYDICPINFIFEQGKKTKLYIGQMAEGEQIFEKVG